MYIVCHADDLVIGFQRDQDARTMRAALAARLAKFGLELHPDKTRVIRFARFAREQHQARGLGKPATLDFLGFTHIAVLLGRRDRPSWPNSEMRCEGDVIIQPATSIGGSAAC